MDYKYNISNAKQSYLCFMFSYCRKIDATRYYGWDLNLQLHLQTSGNEKLSPNRVKLMVEFILRVSRRAPQPLPIKCTIFHSLFLHFLSLPWLHPPPSPCTISCDITILPLAPLCPVAGTRNGKEVK